MINVATHKDTTKNSWNIPSAEVIQHIESKLADCDNDLIILTHDPTLTFLLEQKELSIISPHSKITGKDVNIRDNAQCVIAIKTYAGGISDDRLTRMYKSLEEIRKGSVAVSKIGRDDNYKLKQRLDSRYPEFQCELIYMRDVTGLNVARVWQR